MKFKELIVGSRLIDAVENASLNSVTPSDSQLIDSSTLVFDSGLLSIHNPARLFCDSGQSAGLRSIIGLVVTETFNTKEDLTIVFDGRIIFRVSLREEDFIGPEAAVFNTVSGEIVVFN